ncbi:hypothetical protein [Escherichia coli]|uniref:hypothetical protein n=1 Tax=Escherichia coli TaxID=562 RepID=UPI000C23855A|nr:hypothetical protein [Escherichia coli]PJI60773.1 hypothetical protein CTU84_01235 [Escherichia coli]PJI65331.1 hypothetical protein CTY41_00735 [Escherichia coli]
MTSSQHPDEQSPFAIASPPYSGGPRSGWQYHSVTQDDEQEGGLASVRKSNPAHCIATHPKARHNPVLAFHLIQSGANFAYADKQLNNSPRRLSGFTDRFMEKRVSGWELFSDEERNQAAFARSISFNDDNGYMASMRAAESAIQRYVIPLTLNEMVRKARALYEERYQAHIDAGHQRLKQKFESMGYTWTPPDEQKEPDGEVNRDPQYTGVYFRDMSTGI